MNEQTQHYGHPGITDPLADEGPGGAALFASSALAVELPGATLPSETIDLAKEFTEAGLGQSCGRVLGRCVTTRQHRCFFLN